jgi:threonine aldolase
MIDLREPRLDPTALLAALERRGVRMVQFGPRRLRAVTHLDVDDAGIEHASSAFSDVVGELLA